ncbi:MAG: hypothetical protein QM644_08340 [Mobilitalea sp.]
MTKKKSSFLTFCFSFLPGAGQMYMGFMKRGISLMSAFFFLIFLSVFLYLSPILFALPIIWFYAFFDTFNLRSLPDEVFNSVQDDYLFSMNFARETTSFLEGKFRNIVALTLIFVGVYILWDNFIDIFGSLLPDALRSAFYSIGNRFPQLIISVAIIALGVYLVRGKKKALDAEEQFTLLQENGGFKNE